MPVIFGAGGRGRTDTVLPPRDFESRTSANSITPAHNYFYMITYFSKKSNSKFNKISLF